MSPDAYRAMAQTEEIHWWFVGRRTMLQGSIESLDVPPGANISEIGSGTGGNLPMLCRFLGGMIRFMEVLLASIECTQPK